MIYFSFHSVRVPAFAYPRFLADAKALVDRQARQASADRRVCYFKEMKG